MLKPYFRPDVRRCLYDPKVRGLVYQAILGLVVVGVLALGLLNVVENLRSARITSGFGFLGNIAGFDISQTLISFSAAGSTYGAAFLVGLLNTLVVGALGIVLATVLGVAVGIARLSRIGLISGLATGYVEVLRNLPLLLQLLFWYNAVLAALPDPRASLHLAPGVWLNARGLFVPAISSETGTWFLPTVLGTTFAMVLLLRRARSFLQRRGASDALVRAVGDAAFGLTLLALVVIIVAGGWSVELPTKGTFNLTGGLRIYPEFIALVLGLSIYTSAFVGEIVRAGILAVPKGQAEAARAIGLKSGEALQLIILPQALRVILPPLTSQYLNVVKNSSLAVAIGYPDLVQVFMGTVLNQTGQAIEIVTMTMGVYLTISLTTSAAMNAYNARVAIVER